MSGAETRRVLPALPAEWREKRDARRQLLEQVRARRRMAMRGREERRKNR